MKPKFELLEHPSDIGVLGRGATREEALAGAAHGLVSILADPVGFRPLEERYFHATGRDEAAQIVNWLDEILFFFETDGIIFVEFAVTSWTANEIIGSARGERIDFDRHEFRTAVKGVTYHQFSSHKTPDGWEIRVFLDV